MKRVAVLAGFAALAFLACDGSSSGNNCATPNPNFNPLDPSSPACLDGALGAETTSKSLGNDPDNEGGEGPANAIGEDGGDDTLECPPGLTPQMLDGSLVCLEDSSEESATDGGGDSIEEATESATDTDEGNEETVEETRGPGGGGPPGCQDGSFKCELGTLWKCEGGGWTKEEVCGSPVDCNAEDGNCEKCAPSCAGKGCGDDGCGGSCGSCGPGQICVNDNCQIAETENEEEVGGDNTEETGGDNTEETGGDNTEETGGDNTEETGGDNTEETGGDNTEETGGDNTEETGGDNTEETGGDNTEETGGDNTEETGGGEGYDGPDEAVDCDPLGTGKNVGQYAKNVTWQDSTGQSFALHDLCGSNLILFVETADW